MYMTPPAFRLARHRTFQENASGRSSWTNLEANVSNVLHCMVGLGCIAKVRKSSREGKDTMCGISLSDTITSMCCCETIHPTREVLEAQQMTIQLGIVGLRWGTFLLLREASHGCSHFFFEGQRRKSAQTYRTDMAVLQLGVERDFYILEYFSVVEHEVYFVVGQMLRSVTSCHRGFFLCFLHTDSCFAIQPPTTNRTNYCRGEIRATQRSLRAKSNLNLLHSPCFRLQRVAL